MRIFRCAGGGWQLEVVGVREVTERGLSVSLVLG